MPRSTRALRHIDPVWQQLAVGQRIPDYGGKNGYLDCFYLRQNEAIGYESTRGNTTMTWVLTFLPINEGTRVLIRLRIKSFKRSFPLLRIVGKMVDHITIAGLEKGLNERLRANAD